MKKGIMIVGFVVSIILIVLGIFGFSVQYLDEDKQEIPQNENVEEKIRNEIQNLKQAKNLTWQMNVVTENDDENASTLVKLNLGTKESEMVMNMAGQEVIHSYTVLEDGNLTSYTRMALMGEKWIKLVDEESNITYDSSYLDIILKQFGTLEKKADTLYQITIPKEEAQKMWETMTSDSEENTDEIITDVFALIVFSGKTVDSIQLDFSNAVQTTDGMLTKYVVNNFYSNVGSTIITVPEQVKNNAVIF